MVAGAGVATGRWPDLPVIKDDGAAFATVRHMLVCFPSRMLRGRGSVVTVRDVLGGRTWRRAL